MISKDTIFLSPSPKIAMHHCKKTVSFATTKFESESRHGRQMIRASSVSSEVPPPPLYSTTAHRQTQESSMKDYCHLPTDLPRDHSTSRSFRLPGAPLPSQALSRGRRQMDDRKSRNHDNFQKRDKMLLKGSCSRKLPAFECCKLEISPHTLREISSMKHKECRTTKSSNDWRAYLNEIVNSSKSISHRAEPSLRGTRAAAVVSGEQQQRKVSKHKSSSPISGGVSLDEGPEDMGAKTLRGINTLLASGKEYSNGLPRESGSTE